MYNPDDFLNFNLNVTDKEDISDDDDDTNVCEKGLYQNNSCLNCGKSCIAIDSTVGLVICQSCGTARKSEIIVSHSPIISDSNSSSIHQNRTIGANSMFKSAGGITWKGKLGKVSGWLGLGYSDRQLHKIFQKMKILAGPNVTAATLAEAQALVVTVFSKVSTRGEPRQALIAACFMYACKIEGNGVSNKEIAKKYGISTANLTAAMNRFNNVIISSHHGKKIIEASKNTITSQIRLYCERLLMSERHVQVANEIAETAKVMSLLCDPVPISIAVSCIYFMIIHWKIKLPTEEIIRIADQQHLNMEHKEDLTNPKKKNIERALLKRVTGRNEITITKVYEKLVPFTEYLVTNIDVTNEQLQVVLPKTQPVFI
tara:strand:+ start:10807 stop:11922 length:1116 start_codon:yes stop_codon:yes gene_type:complete